MAQAVVPDLRILASDTSAQSPTSDILLAYDESHWRERIVQPKNTLQIFITDKCNLRCPECFYGQWLGSKEMSFEEYTGHVLKYKKVISKVTLLGGEPTLHKQLPRFIEFNAGLGFKTTVYTNGINVAILREVMQDSRLRDMVSVRIGVHGLTMSEKPLQDIKSTELPVTIVYMVARYNEHELVPAVRFAEANFNCTGFYISSIREIEKTGSFWLDTERTLSMSEYAEVVQRFVNAYDGNIRTLHLSTRGVIVTRKQNFENISRCRFGSILRDGTYITAPLDISINKAAPELQFDTQPCSRHHKCVLQKIILERI